MMRVIHLFLKIRCTKQYFERPLKENSAFHFSFLCFVSLMFSTKTKILQSKADYQLFFNDLDEQCLSMFQWRDDKARLCLSLSYSKLTVFNLCPSRNFKARFFIRQLWLIFTIAID